VAFRLIRRLEVRAGLRKTIDKMHLASVAATTCFFSVTSCLAAEISVVSSMPLSGASQIQNTTSATAFVGYRPWDGTEIYVDPELMQGFGLHNTLGVAGFPNGEAQKSNFPMPRIDIARVFVRQTSGLGGEQETIEEGPNQLAGKQDISRISVTAGRFAVLDVFDGNSYSHDPRVDFLNWNMYCCGSYDVTMDKIGYTWGAAAELNQKS
jgi:high affinity Mn2+ porin